jgi:hypothetical protein
LRYTTPTERENMINNWMATEQEQPRQTTQQPKKTQGE